MPTTMAAATAATVPATDPANTSVDQSPHHAKPSFLLCSSPLWGAAAIAIAGAPAAKGAVMALIPVLTMTLP